MQELFYGFLWRSHARFWGKASQPHSFGHNMRSSINSFHFFPHKQVFRLYSAVCSSFAAFPVHSQAEALIRKRNPAVFSYRYVRRDGQDTDSMEGVRKLFWLSIWGVFFPLSALKVLVVYACLRLLVIGTHS